MKPSMWSVEHCCNWIARIGYDKNCTIIPDDSGCFAPFVDDGNGARFRRTTGISNKYKNFKVVGFITLKSYINNNNIRSEKILKQPASPMDQYLELALGMGQWAPSKPRLSPSAVKLREAQAQNFQIEYQYDKYLVLQFKLIFFLF